MAIRTKRRMISRPKKSKAQILMEQMKRRKLEEPKKKSSLERLSSKTLRETLKEIGDPSHLLFTSGREGISYLTKKPVKGSEKIEYISGPDLKTRREIESILKRRSVIKRAKAAIRHQRKRAIKGAKDIIAGRMIKSSWISELRYFPEEEKAWVMFQGRKYTVFNIRETLFTAWWFGAAATKTDDPTGAKRWNIDDTPSLGAFFNQRIKPKWGKLPKGWL